MGWPGCGQPGCRPARGRGTPGPPRPAGGSWTSTPRWSTRTPTAQSDRDLARLELRHRRHARVEDRIRAAKATGLANLPFDPWRRNAVWLELVLAAQDLTCWLQTLLLDGELALAEPKRLRTRLLHTAGRLVAHARQLILRLPAAWPWAAALATAFARLQTLLPTPG
jgi:hypothetical protein